MRTHFVLLALLLTVAAPIHANAEKRALIDSCRGAETGHSTAKKACKSGDFPGEIIVTCKFKNNGSFKQKDRRRCNSDGERKGVYLENCAGTEVSYNSVKSACRSGNFEGQTVVRCKNGREKKRLTCAAAAEGSSRTTIFKEACGGEAVNGTNNLARACRGFAGTLMVKCRRKRGIWVEKKKMLCGTDGTRDKLTFKKCTAAEAAMIRDDYDQAEQRTGELIADTEAALAAGGMSNQVRRKMESVLKKLNRIKTGFRVPRTVKCRTNQGLCGSAAAHTLPVGHSVRYCDNYMSQSPRERVSIVIHELAHYRVQAFDGRGSKRYFCRGGPRPTASHAFHTNAYYYGLIADCGLVVPPNGS